MTSTINVNSPEGKSPVSQPDHWVVQQVIDPNLVPGLTQPLTLGGQAVLVREPRSQDFKPPTGQGPLEAATDSVTEDHRVAGKSLNHEAHSLLHKAKAERWLIW
ncbi:hypothetical protein PoB_001571900 [Plakobranchus ocellatus]|uniref:Uncharacterized protein n=1 Tax=Plakobranchus ocellatus TaxID=259542 RepID=A0AAV3Z5D7_9GAST|nr:hypothetical protein PoB_001571900 [Plakobranchus ocellatus]